MVANLFGSVKYSIIKKLIFSYILVLFIPLLIGGIYFNHYSQNILQEKLLSTTLTNLQQVDRNISEKIEFCTQNINLIRWDKNIIDFMQTSNFTEPYLMVDSLMQDIVPKLSMIRSQNINVYSLYILHGNKKIPTVYDDLYFDSGISSGYWLERLHRSDNHSNVEDRVFVETTHEEADRDSGKTFEKVFSINRPLFSSNLDRLTGVIRLNILESELLGSLYALKPITGEVFVLADDQGNFLYSSNGEFNRVSFMELLKDDNSISVSLIEGKKFFTVKRYIESIHSWLVSYIPQEGLYLMNEYKTALITVLSAGFLGLCIISIFLSKLILRNLLKLTNAINLIKKGDLDIKVQINSPDEIGVLSANFNEMIENIKRLNAEEKEVIYKALYHEIRPHFLCNALDMVRVASIANGDKKTAGVISHIMNYFMYNTSKYSKCVSLKEELKNVIDYIEIYNLISKKKVEYGIEISENLNGRLSEYEIVKFVFQPLVENSIMHGFIKKAEGCFILLELKLEDNTLKISIEDNGKGISAQRLQEIRAYLGKNPGEDFLKTESKGIGLKNIHERLKIYYGSSYSIEVESSEEIGTRIVLAISKIN